MAKFEFNGQAFEFDPFELENAEKYQDALDAVIEAGKEIKPTDKVSVRIRKECKSVFDFVDTLLGEGAHRSIFGESTNLKTSLSVFEQITSAVTAELNDFNKTYSTKAKAVSGKAKK